MAVEPGTVRFLASATLRVTVTVPSPDALTVMLTMRTDEAPLPHTETSNGEFSGTRSSADRHVPTSTDAPRGESLSDSVPDADLVRTDCPDAVVAFNRSSAANNTSGVRMASPIAAGTCRQPGCAALDASSEQGLCPAPLSVRRRSAHLRDLQRSPK